MTHWHHHGTVVPWLRQPLKAEDRLRLITFHLVQGCQEIIFGKHACHIWSLVIDNNYYLLWTGLLALLYLHEVNRFLEGGVVVFLQCGD